LGARNNPVIADLVFRFGATKSADALWRKMKWNLRDGSRETVSLIGSDKVEGMAVYGADEKKVGQVERVMLDKMSGKVAYAVLSFGSFIRVAALAPTQSASVETSSSMPSRA
jgi:hypothetical protein